MSHAWDRTQEAYRHAHVQSKQKKTKKKKQKVKTKTKPNRLKNVQQQQQQQQQQQHPPPTQAAFAAYQLYQDMADHMPHSRRSQSVAHSRSQSQSQPATETSKQLTSIQASGGRNADATRSSRRGSRDSVDKNNNEADRSASARNSATAAHGRQQFRSVLSSMPKPPAFADFTSKNKSLMRLERSTLGLTDSDDDDDDGGGGTKDEDGGDSVHGSETRKGSKKHHHHRPRHVKSLSWDPSSAWQHNREAIAPLGGHAMFPGHSRSPFDPKLLHPQMWETTRTEMIKPAVVEPPRRVEKHSFSHSQRFEKPREASQLDPTLPSDFDTTHLEHAHGANWAKDHSHRTDPIAWDAHFPGHAERYVPGSTKEILAHCNLGCVPTPEAVNHGARFGKHTRYHAGSDPNHMFHNDIVVGGHLGAEMDEDHVDIDGHNIYAHPHRELELKTYERQQADKGRALFQAASPEHKSKKCNSRFATTNSHDHIQRRNEHDTTHRSRGRTSGHGNDQHSHDSMLPDVKCGGLVFHHHPTPAEDMATQHAKQAARQHRCKGKQWATASVPARFGGNSV